MPMIFRCEQVTSYLSLSVFSSGPGMNVEGCLLPWHKEGASAFKH
jgi:hypothetical protein